MHGDYMTCMEMYGSGHGIGGKMILVRQHAQILRVRPLAPSAWYAAARGSATRSTSALRSVTSTALRAGGSTTVFVWCAPKFCGKFRSAACVVRAPAPSRREARSWRTPLFESPALNYFCFQIINNEITKPFFQSSHFATMLNRCAEASVPDNL